MKRFFAIAIVAICVSLAVHAQSSLSDDARALKAFSVPVPIEGGPVWVTILTDKTANVLWRGAPAEESILSDAANSGVVLYVMGIATKDFVLAPEYSIEQDGKTSIGKAINIRNLSGGAVQRGETILGLIAFDNKIDLSRLFTLSFGGGRVDVVLNPDDVKRWGTLTRASQPAPTAQAAK